MRRCSSAREGRRARGDINDLIKKRRWRYEIYQKAVEKLEAWIDGEWYSSYRRLYMAKW